MINTKIYLKWIFACLVFVAIELQAWENDFCFDDGFDDGYLYEEIIPAGYFDLWKLYGGYSFGKDVGVNHSYGTLGITVFPQENLEFWKPFVDVEGHWLSNYKWAANIGVGIRRFGPYSPDVVWGFNLYYDYRRGDIHKDCNQIGVGFEWLHPWGDLRINGYIPVGNHVNVTKHVYKYPGGAIITCIDKESLIGGFDAEVGRNLLCGCSWALYGALGPYYFAGSKGFDHAWGARLRFAFRCNDWLELAISGTRDDHFKSRALATVAITIPFETLLSPSVGNCFRWWDQPVHRQPIIGLEHKTHFSKNF